MARAVTRQRKIVNTALAWGIGFLIFFPILWTILTSFKTEAQAIADPPIFLGFDWTLANYEAVLERSNYGRFLWNSIIIAGGSTVLGILIAVPAAWSMAFVPGKRTKDILLWMLSTKMLPAVGVLYPIYLLCIQFGVLDSKIALVIILMLINLPIIVWMLYTYFREIPGEILEAARMDGASLREEMLYVLTPWRSPALPPPCSELHPRMERSLLDTQPHRGQSGTAHGLHRELFQPRRPFLRQAQRGLPHGHRANPHPRLVQPETTRQRPDFRRSQVSKGQSHGTN